MAVPGALFLGWLTFVFDFVTTQAITRVKRRAG
jgi:hypothetical protein